MRHVLAIAVLVACGGAPRPVGPVKTAVDTDPQGPHRAAIAAQLQPMIDGELARAIVIGIYDAGKLEIYGFGTGPGGTAPSGHTIFEIGAVTKVYTALLLADSVQRQEVALDTPVGELLPPGVTAPVRDKRVITLHHLVDHSSGLPPLPPSITAASPPDNPLAGYDENRLYADLVRTQLVAVPGDRILISEYGSGLLAHVLGRKVGSSATAAIEARIVKPLGLSDTFFAVPAADAARRAQGSDSDLAPVKPWSWGVLAGAGGLYSSARDQLKLIDAELDGAAGSRQTLRPAMKFTQEAQLQGTDANIGLGWQIDREGRYWHTGTTNGFHAFVGFDVKARRGLVILAASATPIIDQVSGRLYKILAGEAVANPTLPTAAQLADYAGAYNFSGAKLDVKVDGKRLYVEGPGEPRIRMMPISDHEFWMQSLKAIVVFQRGSDNKIVGAVFVVGDQQMAAPRMEKAP